MIGWRNARAAHEREADWVIGRVSRPMGALLLLNSVRPQLCLVEIKAVKLRFLR